MRPELRHLPHFSQKSCMRFIHWLLMILLLSVVLQGQQNSSAECSRKTIPLAVLDREYRFVENLKPTSLRIRAGQHTVTVDRISRTSPHRMILLLDVSGSVVQKNKWHVLQLLAHDVVRSAPPEVEIALGTFQDDYRQ